MQGQGPEIIIVDTITASAADWVQNNQYLYFKGYKLGRYNNSDSNLFRYVAAVTEVPQVDTLTAVGTANSITYGFYIKQLVDLTTGLTYQNYYQITTPATGSVTPTTIHAQFIALINADSRLKITASGTTTLILTSDAGYAQFNVTLQELGNGLTNVHTTAGVRAVGDTAELNRMGLAGLFSGSVYKKLYVTYNKPAGAQTGMGVINQPNDYLFLISTAASNYAALNTRITEWMGAFPSGGSTYPDPENESQG